MSDSQPPADSVDVDAAVWTASVRFPDWWAAHIGPKLYGALRVLPCLRDPQSGVNDCLAEVRRMCEDKIRGDAT